LHIPAIIVVVENQMQRSALAPCLVYRDPKSALAWLEAAFGFEIFLLIEDADGNLAHAEMVFGDSLIMVGNEWTQEHRSPMSNSGLMSQTVHIQITDPAESIDAHCERARQAGATIVAEPSNQFYGDRTYRCKDPEGHLWTIGQTIETLTAAEWDQNSGLKTVVFRE
jgi:uncharacterized glyoxalase superfamily protein PhnB